MYISCEKEWRGGEIGLQLRLILWFCFGARESEGGSMVEYICFVYEGLLYGGTLLFREA
jgi:hypothetical protein